jgi:hypothetical protein
MRYLDAYEIIRSTMKKAELELPLTGSFLSNFFDRHVNDIGLRVVRNRKSFDLTISGTSYLIGEDDFSDRIYKVQTTQSTDKVLVPFIPEASIHTGITTTEVDNIGYYTSHLISKSGTITDVSAASNGNLQLASGYIGLAEKLEKDYLQLTATKKSRQYILRQPLTEFI